VTRKFAQITAGILARKGEAMPSLIDGETFCLPDVKAEEPRPAPKIAEPPHISWASELGHAFVADITSGKQLPKKTRRKGPRAATDPGTRKLFLKVSARENERLEIAAVKLGATRNDLLKNAILSYLDQLTREFENRCGCIAGRSGESENCCTEMEDSEPARRLA
jgi:hypothetical protein